MLQFRVNKLGESLLLLTIIELLLCGSGQILHLIGGLTARMFLFLVIFIVYIGYLQTISKSLDRTDKIIIGYYLLLFFFSTSIALIRDSNLSYIFADIKPLSYFFVFPFFIYFINNYNIISKIILIIKYATLIMAVLYLLYLVLIRVLGIIDFSIFYSSMSEESDFMFRGTKGELFYKGFVYLPIGLTFWFAEKKWIPSLILLLAIYFTLTRGFYIMTLTGLGLYIFITNRNGHKKLLIIFSAIALVAILLSSNIFDMGSERSGADMDRIITLQQVLEKINILSIFFGYGFGDGVAIRPVHMENSFLEIFNKQGFIGILFWVYFLTVIVYYTYQSRYYFDFKTPLVFCIGCVSFYVQSLFNPFISNPIGIGYLIISYSVCKYYYKGRKKYDERRNLNLCSDL